MGISYDGGMIIGCKVYESKIIAAIDDIGDFAEENGMEYMSPWFDADPEYWTIGFSVDDISVEDISDTWIEHLKAKAYKFKQLSGVKAKLIGTQSIW